MASAQATLVCMGAVRILLVLSIALVIQALLVPRAMFPMDQARRLMSTLTIPSLGRLCAPLGV